MKKTLKTFLFLILSIVLSIGIRAQNGSCDLSVPNLFISLTGNSNSTSVCPDSIILCANESSLFLHGRFVNGLGPYQYFWTKGINGTKPFDSLFYDYFAC